MNLIVNFTLLLVLLPGAVISTPVACASPTPPDSPLVTLPPALGEIHVLPGEGAPADEAEPRDASELEDGSGRAGGPMALPAEVEDTARRAVHLLEYIAVDYAGAVSGGLVVRQAEYDEQLSFLGEIERQLTDLGIAAKDPLRGALAALRADVQARASAAEVSERARSLAAELRLRFAPQELPPRTPSVQAGERLYAQACASCHGPTGDGNGVRAAELDPKPASFRNRERMLSLPLSAVFATISYGIEDTSMASFAEVFDVAQRYDLAFFVGSLAYTRAEIARGAELAGADPKLLAAHIAGISELISTPAAELGAASADTAALVAYARAHPEALDDSPVSLAVARQQLDASWRAYEAGDERRAVDLAISAYLDGFEPVEARLEALQSELRTTVEADFLHYRELLRAGEPKTAVAAQRGRLMARLADAERALAGGELAPAAAFVASLTILAREGFEAILIVLAISALLVRAGRRDALRYLHAGWMSALAGGGVTWLLARRLIDISGADREVIEGASSLLAAGILFYVSYWLIAKVASQRWQSFLQSRVHTALRGGSLWTLAIIAFVAVYREAFETILFFEAVTAQAGPSGLHAVLLGIVAGALLLAVLALGAFRFGLRMPVRRFFFVSSGLLYALAIVLAGQGVAALQEAGLVPVTSFPFVQVDWLGVHPTLQSLGAQALLLAAAAMAGAWTLMRRSRDSGASARNAAA